MSIIKHFRNIKVSRMFCHRLPDRTFKIGKWYFPICSRCTGFYLGAFSYLILFNRVYVHYTNIMILISLLMLLAAFLDGTTQFIGLRESNNSLRFTTGFIGGVGLVIFYKTVEGLYF